MENSVKLESLYRYALEFEFDAFTELFQELVSKRPKNELLDGYLIRALIKIFASDPSFMDDLETAEQIGGAPALPCLYEGWLPDSANRFVVIAGQPGQLERFLQQLELAGEKLARWYGEMGRCAARLIQGEIYYYLGHLEPAIALAQAQLSGVPNGHPDCISARFTLLRCYLALGDIPKTQQCLLDTIQIKEDFPRLANVYQTVRDWVITTTAWSGDMPRYFSERPGELLPVLEERMTAVQDGICKPTPLEKPFVDYAVFQNIGDYTVRQYYLDIFYAMQWYQAKDPDQIAACFERVYRVYENSRLTMPFVEYGEQIIPLLEHLKSSGAADLSELISLAGQYEKNLNAYRD